MSYEPFYFVEADGSVPVRDYILSLPSNAKAKIYAFIDYIADHGPQAKRPHADYMGNSSKLYELRPKPHRVIYFFYHGKKIVLLHCFEKDSKKIEDRDIKIATDRMSRCLESGKIKRVEDKTGRGR